MSRPLGLYVHLPFCVRKCPYCAFNSHALTAEDSLEGYAAALELEARRRRAEADRPVTSVFFGGGTPTVYPAQALVRILSTLRSVYGFAPDCEVTVEANPGTVAPADFVRLRRGGFTRVSIGGQSFHPDRLRVLGRIHEPGEIAAAVTAAQEVFAQVNLDLMWALPGQELAEWQADLEQAVALGPSHLSLYGLEIEAGTRFATLYRQGRLKLPDEASALAMGALARRRLARAGYVQYEVSGWARPGCRSRHNLNYWRRGEYLGLGAGAHSFVGGVRSWNLSSPSRYARALADGGLARQGWERPDRNEAADEWLALRLRLVEGFSEAAFRRAFGLTVSEAFPGVLAELCALGLLVRGAGRVRLSARGRMLMNRVVLELSARRIDLTALPPSA